MRVELSYGKGSLALELPDGLDATLIRKPVMPVLSEPLSGVEAALNTPVAARPLVDEARGARSACILICDITRPVPNELLLPPLVRALLEAGLQADQIRVLVATGLHR